MPRKPSEQSADDNLVLAVCFITAFAGLSAFSSAYISAYVLDQLQNTDALVMIVVDGGKMKSDSADLERNMSSATAALLAVRDLGIALSVGCVGIAVAMGVRYLRRDRS